MSGKRQGGVREASGMSQDGIGEESGIRKLVTNGQELIKEVSEEEAGKHQGGIRMVCMYVYMYVYVEFVPLYSCLHTLRELSDRTVTLVKPLLLTSGVVRYEAVFHSCGTSPMEGRY